MTSDFKQLALRLYKYRNLLLVFVWREFIVRYKQAVLGVAWALFQPLSMMMLFVVVFGLALQIETGGAPYPLFFLSGLIPWAFFSNSLNYSIPSLTNHYSLITKIYFPREIIPISGIFVFFFDFLISFLIYILMFFLYGYHVDFYFFYLVPLFVIMFVYTLTLALVLSSLNVYYRDVKMASGFIVQVLFFISPVFYTLKTVKNDYAYMIYLNPLSYVIESIRDLTLYGSPPNLSLLMLYSVVVSGGLLLAWRLFVKMEGAFADVI